MTGTRMVLVGWILFAAGAYLLYHGYAGRPPWPIGAFMPF